MGLFFFLFFWHSSLCFFLFSPGGPRSVLISVLVTVTPPRSMFATRFCTRVFTQTTTILIQFSRSLPPGAYLVHLYMY